MFASTLVAQAMYPQQHYLLSESSLRDADIAANAKLNGSMVCRYGDTPKFEALIENTEYFDAKSHSWFSYWIEAIKEEVKSRDDLKFEGLIKHYRKHLCLALDIHDDFFTELKRSDSSLQSIPMPT